MNEPTEQERMAALSAALQQVATLGVPIRELSESIDALKKSIDELTAVQRENQQQ